jgi:Cytochrome C oxidase subunit II, periplasmic domain
LWIVNRNGLLFNAQQHACRGEWAGREDHGKQVPFHAGSHHPGQGKPVTLQLTSTDATHGFLLRALKIDTDIKPGAVIEKTVTPMTAGTFKAICDHYCGLGHSGMKMTVIVQDATAKASSEHVLTASNTISR